MKKFFVLLIGLSLFLTACGGDNEQNKSANENESAQEEEANANNENEEKETEEESNSQVSDTSFDDGNYVYEIKEVEQLESSLDEDTQILAVEISFTNNTDDNTSPWMAVGIRADQETDNSRVAQWC